MDILKETPAQPTSPAMLATEPIQREQAPSRPQRPKPKSNTTYDKTLESLAYVASFCIAAALWYVGAYFTLAAIAELGIATTHLAWWLIPLAITAIELSLIEKIKGGWQSIAIFASVLALDIASSWYGIVTKLGGEFVPLGAGFSIPTTGTVLHAGAIIASLIFAFAPEKIARWAFSEIGRVWKWQK